jgi:RNA polymerase sigma-70 factor (ECF subfamily)
MTTDDQRIRFEGVFRDHAGDLLAYALRRTADPADAADVVAETFTAAWRRMDRLPAGPEARLWLFGTARRVLANHRRGRRRRDALAERLQEHLAALGPPPPPDEGLGAVVRDALAALRPDDREVLTLVCWEGLEPAEAAAVLAIPPATARTRLHRARARMRAELARRGVAPATPMEVAR